MHSFIQNMGMATDLATSIPTMCTACGGNAKRAPPTCHPERSEGSLQAGAEVRLRGIWIPRRPLRDLLGMTSVRAGVLACRDRAVTNRTYDVNHMNSC